MNVAQTEFSVNRAGRQKVNSSQESPLPKHTLRLVVESSRSVLELAYIRNNQT